MNKKKGIEGFTQHVDATKQHHVDAKINDLVTQNQKLERKYNILLDEHAQVQEENDLLTSVDLRDVTPIEVKPTGKGARRGGYALAVASDWHVLETVKPDQVNGLNIYNRQIAQQSVEAFWQGVYSWLQVHRGSLHIPAMGVALLGDFITNMIHDDQVESNEGTPQEEILFALDLMIGGIDFLLEKGDLERLDLYCCDGNHGRDTKFTRKANRVKHSHEWLLYNFLMKWYSGKDDRVKFHIAGGYHLYAEIFGKRVRMHHGDEVRYQGGVGGLTIPMNKAIAQWDKAMRADLDIFGHFHHFLNPTKFIANGSILGYNPYALSIKAAYEPPVQIMTTFDEKHGLTSVDRIYVR